MIRRYDLRRSDNFPFTGKKAYTCSGDGYITITTGYPMTRTYLFELRFFNRTVFI